jgi:Phage Connector (GP10)
MANQFVNTIGYGAPTFYDHQNAYNSTLSPSTMHASDTGLQWYFRRYLLQKAIAVFKWKIPERWAKNYFLYCLYCWGYIAIVNTNKFGVIPQGCSLSGYDVMYQPTHATIANPLLRGILQPRIDVQCALIRLQPDYGGIMDKVNFYADIMALSAETVGTNLFNSKLAYVFGCASKNQSETFKKMYDNIASGEPAQFVNKELFNEDGSPNWMIFNQNLKQTYIVSDVMDDMRKWELKFCSDLGIPNSNTEKKERLIEAEVESNDVEVKLWADLALEELQKGCKKANDLFGIDLSVDWRYKEVMTDGNESSNGSDKLLSVR